MAHGSMSADASDCPRFAWMVLMFFGFFNLTRGFMHSVLVEYAAANIAGLDLSVVRAEIRCVVPRSKPELWRIARGPSTSSGNSELLSVGPI
ncbi:MAG: hypothetical protein JSW05_09250 [Candidatus Thorarchaeota archaeon]|nr:MAG: hypothetical protein JSW05_09250 [Candidatus Thorarchaeota archaeon]